MRVACPTSWSAMNLMSCRYSALREVRRSEADQISCLFEVDRGGRRKGKGRVAKDSLDAVLLELLGREPLEAVVEQVKLDPLLVKGEGKRLVVELGLVHVVGRGSRGVDVHTAGRRKGSRQVGSHRGGESAEGGEEGGEGGDGKHDEMT
jgi:hypothetical protein